MIKSFADKETEKWRIASDKGGSGNTANIGNISNIADIINSRGDTSLLISKRKFIQQTCYLRNPIF